MDEPLKNEILAGYYASLASYERVAAEIRRLFDAELDPSVPSGAIYTINHRLKSEPRFLEKIEAAAIDGSDVSRDTFADVVRDMLGMRIVCLRLSDVERVESFIASLRDEDKLRFVEGPTRKKTFVLSVDPREQADSEIDLQYSGYSSTHYLVTLGSGAGAPQQLMDLRGEIQVRTILEEAWGEIDHKYRYEVIRAGDVLPDHVHRGFYSFAAYLQAAALQAEYLCSEADLAAEPIADSASVAPDESAGSEPALKLTASLVRPALQTAFGFEPTVRTATYAARRLGQAGVDPREIEQLEQTLLSKTILDRFRDIYGEAYAIEPFTDYGRRDVDLINALNFAIVSQDRGQEVAETGLRSVLDRRRSAEEQYEVVLDGDDSGLRARFGRPVEVGDKIRMNGSTYEVVKLAGSDVASGKLICVRVDGAPGDELIA